MFLCLCVWVLYIHIEASSFKQSTRSNNGSCKSSCESDNSRIWNASRVTDARHVTLNANFNVLYAALAWLCNELSNLGWHVGFDIPSEGITERCSVELASRHSEYSSARWIFDCKFLIILSDLLSAATTRRDTRVEWWERLMKFHHSGAPVSSQTVIQPSFPKSLMYHCV